MPALLKSPVPSPKITRGRETDGLYARLLGASEHRDFSGPLGVWVSFVLALDSVEDVFRVGIVEFTANVGLLRDWPVGKICTSTDVKDPWYRAAWIDAAGHPSTNARAPAGMKPEPVLTMMS